MSEINAQSTFSCPSCGAQATWNAAKQMLVCEFCGTSAPMQPGEAEGGLAEHCLVTAMREIGDDHRGWATERKSVKCQSCQAISVLPGWTSKPPPSVLRLSIGQKSSR